TVRPGGPDGVVFAHLDAALLEQLAQRPPEVAVTALRQAELAGQGFRLDGLVGLLGEGSQDLLGDVRHGNAIHESHESTRKKTKDRNTRVVSAPEPWGRPSCLPSFQGRQEGLPHESDSPSSGSTPSYFSALRVNSCDSWTLSSIHRFQRW